jgi:hypothetical protein
MAEVMRGRYTARIGGDFVVFLIGMRINRPLRVRKWVPMARKMGPMLKALAEDPASGLLSFEFGWMNRGPALVQYWRSFEHLDRFAKDPGMPHLPAWRWYNQAIKSSGDVAIWHETYKVHAGEYETIYGNLNRFGLAKAGAHLPASRHAQTAAARIGAALEDTPAVAPYETPGVSERTPGA